MCADGLGLGIPARFCRKRGRMLADFVELYKALPSIAKMKPSESPEFLAFRRKRGLPVKIGSVKKFLEKIPHDEAYYSFFQSAPIFWMVPCDTPTGKVYGFVLRSYHGKVYRVLSSPGSIQVVFGFGGFERYKRDYPILVTEGTKDCIYLQTIYRFSLALLSTSLSNEIVKLLRSLTDRVIVAMDNDTMGRKRSGEMVEKLAAAGIRAVELCPRLEDLGDYFVNDNYKQQLMEQLKVLLKKLQ